MLSVLDLSSIRETPGCVAGDGADCCQLWSGTEHCSTFRALVCVFQKYNETLLRVCLGQGD